MNSIIKLSGRLYSKSNPSKPGPAELPKGRSVNSSKLDSLIRQLNEIREYWAKQLLGFSPLVSIYYTVVVAKSNRVSSVFASPGIPSNDSIVGAKFTDETKPKHVITHSVSMDCIINSICNLEKCKQILDEEFNGGIDHDRLELVTSGEKTLRHKSLSKTAFAKLVKDSYYIERFGLPFEMIDTSINESRIVSLYETGLSTEELIHRIGLDDPYFERLDNRTWLLTPSQYSELYKKAPYLISMSLTDFNTMEPITHPPIIRNSNYTIPKPGNEPTIGVIDTLFSNDVYFRDWVEYHELLPKELIDEDDYIHGTEVTSLIVDGPSLNPHLEDGCGRFKVRHFGIAKHDKNSSMGLIKSISSIVQSNKDIKVWNLSLGSEMETKYNSISPEAALLDQIQYENDIVFVVSGTNKTEKIKREQRVGSPADSINSIVVNSVLFSGKPASYSRRGPILCFFNKPDISSYGGDKSDPITVFSIGGPRKKYGTSFAAPWISRKMAFLIHYLKYPREIAKALIIDAACGWDTDTLMQPYLGLGTVPTHINNIVKTSTDEIKFTIQGISSAYETYSYLIPVPIANGAFPYIAKATLCYFPKCSRNQGVDYTDTELDIHFGRLTEKGKIKSIDNNMQGDSDCIVKYEADARKEFRKWDNVKHISEGIKGNNRSKKLYSYSLPNGKQQFFETWGLSIKAKERLENNRDRKLQFGLVITLKAIDGKNRIDEFLQKCRAYVWSSEVVDVQTMIENYNLEEATIVFED